MHKSSYGVPNSMRLEKAPCRDSSLSDRLTPGCDPQLERKLAKLAKLAPLHPRATAEQRDSTQETRQIQKLHEAKKAKCVTAPSPQNYPDNARPCTLCMTITLAPLPHASTLTLCAVDDVDQTCDILFKFVLWSIVQPVIQYIPARTRRIHGFGPSHIKCI